MESLSSAMREELRGEEVLFRAREGRLVSRAGTRGAFGLAVLLLVGALVAFFVRGASDVHISAPGVQGTADEPFIAGLLLVAAAALMVASVVVAVLAVVLPRRPGALVVGTPTRLLREGRRGVRSLRWRDIERAERKEDGTIDLWPFPVGAPHPAWMNQIVEPSDPTLLEKIRPLLTPAPPPAAAQAAAAPGSIAAFEFRASHVPGAQATRRRLTFALGCAGLGIVVALAYFARLASGGTVTLSEDDGPPREIGASEPIAWLPVGLGALIGAVGLGLLWRMRPAPGPVRYVAASDGLVVHPQGGDVTTIPWRSFAGAPLRMSGRHGEEFRIPLRTLLDKEHREQRVLRIIGVEDADRVETVLRTRIEAAG